MYRRDNVFLVEIDDMYALVDQQTRHVHVLNRPAAYAWAHAERGGMDEQFMQELEALHVLCPNPTNNIADLDVPWEAGEPQIISSAPIQVAAGSGQGQFTEVGEEVDPFSIDW